MGKREWEGGSGKEREGERKRKRPVYKKSV